MLNASGQQRSGFGFIHDGSIDTLLDFLRVPVFTFKNDDDRRDVEAFVLSFDTGIAPSVGLQITLTGDSSSEAASRVATASDRLNLLMGQADAGNCDLIVKGVYHGEHRGFLYVGGGMFQPDRQNDSLVSWQTLMQSAAPGSELTFTGVPVGYGRRLGIDHNGDGKLDGDV
jgi:hypothetical protein